MKVFKKLGFVLLCLGVVAGCSRKKNTFVNRNWHAVTAEYNTLFNGNVALQLGIEELNQNYRDNYWEILPVERMQVREEVLAPGENINPNFAVAEQKAVKAIQRHSMLIEGSEKNPQIDEAYLLLGKARYYDQRFVPALEAFNYILHKYPLSNTINEARVWREKTNMRLEFDELAVKNLKKILESENLEDQSKADAEAALAQAYLNLQHPDSAVAPLKRAAKFTEKKEEEGRYWFILGQLYDRLGKKDSANYAFEEVIDLNRKIPRVYLINAEIARIKNSGLPSSEQTVVLRKLLDMANDRENRPFLDKIYFELAEYHYNADSVGMAVDYYNRSLRTGTSNLYLQSLDYETLGNINFDAGNYEVAGAYYDSTLQKLAQNTRDYRAIKRKRDNLDDVIFYENIARTNDSILYVASLSEEEQLQFFTEYTDQLKEKAQSEVQKPTQAQEASNFFENKRPAMPGMPLPANSFYFYNPTAVAYGKQEFFRTWGDRKLVDNWRTRDDANVVADLDSEGIKEIINQDPKYNPETYLQKIPKDPALLDSLKQELNFASYQLGLIYREKFNENILAAEKLEFLLQNDPQERLVLPAKYNLYKIYLDLGENARAQALKNDIIFQYPDSRYAAILQNPGTLLRDENNPTAQYEELYRLYENQEYERVIEKAAKLVDNFTGDEIVPKLELLKAMAEGRYRGLAAYKEGLNYVALNYPQTEEGKKAQDLLKNALPALAKQQFQEDTAAKSFKLVFQLPKAEREKSEALKERLLSILEELNYEGLEVSIDVYDPTQDFVVVHGFSSAERAKGFAELLSTNKEYLVERNSFYISSPNYQIAQIHKNIDAYLMMLNKNPK